MLPGLSILYVSVFFYCQSGKDDYFLYEGIVYVALCKYTVHIISEGGET